MSNPFDISRRTRIESVICQQILLHPPSEPSYVRRERLRVHHGRAAREVEEPWQSTCVT
jgi:hypothetical protein